MPAHRGRGLHDIAHYQGGIGGRFEQYQPRKFASFDRFSKSLRVASRHRPRVEPERLNYLMNQVLSSAVKWLRIDQRGAALKKREHYGYYRGHPGIEHRGGVRAAFERHQLLLQNLSVGMIEPRINQIRTVLPDR